MLILVPLWQLIFIYEWLSKYIYRTFIQNRVNRLFLPYCILHHLVSLILYPPVWSGYAASKHPSLYISFSFNGASQSFNLISGCSRIRNTCTERNLQLHAKALIKWIIELMGNLVKYRCTLYTRLMPGWHKFGARLTHSELVIKNETEISWSSCRRWPWRTLSIYFCQGHLPQEHCFSDSLYSVQLYTQGSVLIPQNHYWDISFAGGYQPIYLGSLISS